MLRKTLFASLILAIAISLLLPVAVSACESCTLTFICSGGYDNCGVLEHCSTAYVLRLYEQCRITWYGTCQESGSICALA